MKINIKIIPGNEQRYPTLGDYWIDKKTGDIEVRSTDTGNKDKDFAVILHELVEWYLIDKKGINVGDIDAFDINFENENGVGEPGDMVGAPYRREHHIADIVERVLLVECGVYGNTAI